MNWLRTRILGLVILCAGSPALADLGPYTVGDIAFGFFPPYAHEIADVPAGQTIHGFHLSGAWTAGAGGAHSAFFRMYGSSPADGVSAALDFGGADNADPYTFDAARYLAYPQGAASGGDWRLSFSSTFPGSSAQMAGTKVTLLEASVTSFGGTTAGAPLWDRPRPGFDGVSTFGPVAYHVQPFAVGVTGRYDIFSSQSFDGFAFLYAGGFDAAAPLVGGLAENDDGRTGEDSSDIWRDRFGSALTLAAGETYYLVTTGFEDGDAGAFTNYIGGVGEVTLVPEPHALWMLLLTAACKRGRR